MDPNAALAEALRLCARLTTAGGPDTGDPAALVTFADDAARLAELVEGLHGWIVKGGFLPALWGGGLAAPRAMGEALAKYEKWIVDEKIRSRPLTKTEQYILDDIRGLRRKAGAQ